MKLKIATSQFPISADISKNKEYILKHMVAAHKQGTDLVHFPEGSLSGYAGVDFNSFEGFLWKQLKDATLEIIENARELEIWVVLGSAHQLSGSNKPYNCLYIINDKGEIVNRYDKMFCSGNESETEGDLKHYNPGYHFCMFNLKGVYCGTLICYDYRFPELYREYKKRGARIMFHSFHAGHMSPTRKHEMEKEVGEEFHAINPGKTYPEITMPSTMISYAANNYMWISASNTSAYESCWGSMLVRPDGVIVNKLEKNSCDLLITEIDTEIGCYDSTKMWRERAMNGIYHTGILVRDERSDKRNEL